MTVTKLAFIGDVMLGRLVDEQIPQRAPESFWGTALPVLRSADAVFANLECAISDRGCPWSRTPKTFFFCARPQAVDVLKAAGIRYVSLANNHILDYEEDAFHDTLMHLDDAGIAHAGAGRTAAEAMMPARLEIGGMKIGVIALTDNEQPFAARHDCCGTYYTEISDDPSVLAPLKAIIDGLRRDGANLIVLSPHWGPNMVLHPPQAFRHFARAAVDAGIDVLHGHSAHVFQGVEIFAGRPILYDTGDVLDDYAVDRILHNDWSFIFMIEIDRAIPVQLTMFPLRLSFARVDLATGREANDIMGRMAGLCSAFGTRPVQSDGMLRLDISS